MKMQTANLTQVTRALSLHQPVRIDHPTLGTCHLKVGNVFTITDETHGEREYSPYYLTRLFTQIAEGKVVAYVEMHFSWTAFRAALSPEQLASFNRLFRNASGQPLTNNELVELDRTSYNPSNPITMLRDRVPSIAAIMNALGYMPKPAPETDLDDIFLD